MAALSLAFVAAQAQAQDPPSEEQRAAAREAFQEGLSAAREGNWQLAREKFEAAYAAVPNPAVLINLAGAQRQLGQNAAAAATYRRYLAEATEGPAARHRETAERELAVIGERLGRITIQVQNLVQTDEVRIGDRNIPLDRLAEVEVDPGQYRVTVVRNGNEIASGEAEVGVGGAALVEIEALPFVPTPEQAAAGFVVPPPVAPARPPEEESGGIFSSPVFWIVVGAVVLLGAATAIILATSGPDDPYVGNFGQGHVEVP